MILESQNLEEFPRIFRGYTKSPHKFLFEDLILKKKEAKEEEEEKDLILNHKTEKFFQEFFLALMLAFNHFFGLFLLPSNNSTP